MVSESTHLGLLIAIGHRLMTLTSGNWPTLSPIGLSLRNLKALLRKTALL